MRGGRYPKADTGALIIPEDALDRCEQITFEQASGTLVPEGVVPLSSIFVAAPEDVNIATEVFVELEFSTENLQEGEVPFVYRASSLTPMASITKHYGDWNNRESFIAST